MDFSYISIVVVQMRFRDSVQYSIAVRMALCIECSPAVQEVPGSIPDCGALIAPCSGCSPMLYADDVGGPGQAPT